MITKHTKQMKKEALENRKQADILWQEAEAIEQAGLLPRYKHLEGKCFKLKDEYVDEKWEVYYLIREVTSVYKLGRKVSATLHCFTFDSRKNGSTFIYDDTQFNDTLKSLRAKEISRAEFDEALESAYANIQLNSEPQ
jgi:hypothetical protein